MRSSLCLAAVAAVTAGVEAIAISSNAASDLLSPTTRRRGCGRSPSSSASLPVSVDVSSTISAATFPTLEPTNTTIVPEVTSETAASTSIGNTDSTISPTEPSVETSETVSATLFGTESSTEAPVLASSTLSVTDSSTIAATGIIPTTLITTEPISDISTTTASTRSTTESATSDASTVSVTESSTGIFTETASSMTETSTTGVIESSATDSTSLATTATSTTTALTCSPTNTVNGDFEAGPSNWTFTGNGAILSNTNDNMVTPYGNYYATLNGFVGITSVIYQAVANVAPNAALSFNYKLAGSWVGAVTCTLTATYADITLGTMTLDATSPAAMDWQTASWPAFDVPALGTLAVSWGQCSSSYSNVALDNVVLTSDCFTPTPSV